MGSYIIMEKESLLATVDLLYIINCCAIVAFRDHTGQNALFYSYFKN